ncbi:hypothetical protein [Streptomyces minutiscleroticus]|uniref:hypothetical protein n=1 Tax=Streptomyces minutiscleroticus TaxID=68238 RepID=UPI00167C56D4|nr:hypothetical protein [Streptomyces minutiscleroticus]
MTATVPVLLTVSARPNVLPRDGGVFVTFCRTFSSSGVEPAAVADAMADVVTAASAAASEPSRAEGADGSEATGGEPTGTGSTAALVHGARVGSSSRNAVIQRPRHVGRPGRAADPVRGLPADTAVLKDVRGGVDGPVVLTGHSCGDAVIGDAAAGRGETP